MQHAREDIAADERAKLVRSIQLLKAFNLYTQHRFDESLALYSQLGTGAHANARAEYADRLVQCTRTSALYSYERYE